MRYNELEYLRNDNKILDKYDFARLFDVVQKGEKSYFNICKTIRIKNLDKMLSKYFTYYQVKPKDTWTNLSYKFFHTYKLWWILCKFNNVQNPFGYLKDGLIIKIPKEQVVNSIIQHMDTI